MTLSVKYSMVTKCTLFFSFSFEYSGGLGCDRIRPIEICTQSITMFETQGASLVFFASKACFGEIVSSLGNGDTQNKSYTLKKILRETEIHS
jgi:hypothetical protein